MMFHVEQKRNKVKATTQTPAIKKNVGSEK